MSLRWCDATYRHHKDLQAFRCTREPLRVELSAGRATPFHSRLWEAAVEEQIRDQRAPNSSSSMKLRLGYDEAGLAAAHHYQEIDPGAHYDIVYVAVASRLRGIGGAVADAMMEDVFAHIGERCVEVGARQDVLVTTLIHHDNHPSKRMCARAGLSFDEMDEHGDYEAWSRLLPVPTLALFPDT